MPARREFDLAQIATARPMTETHPDLVGEMQRRRATRGRPARHGKPMVQTSIRLEAEVLAKFKATGKGWQARINEALKNAEV